MLMLDSGPPAHAAVAKLPRRPYRSETRVSGLLHAALYDARLGGCSLGGPPRGFGQGFGCLFRAFFATLEFTVFARVRQQEIQSCDDPQTQHEAAQVQREGQVLGQARGDQERRRRQRHPRDLHAGARAGGRYGQVIGRIRVIVQAFALDPGGASERYQHEQLHQVHEPRGGRSAQVFLHGILDRVVERPEMRRFEEVAEFVQRNRRMAHQVGEQRGNEGFRAQEDKVQNRFLGGGGFGDREHRGDERDVKGYEDMVGDDPAFLQHGALTGLTRMPTAGWSTGNKIFYAPEQ